MSDTVLTIGEEGQIRQSPQPYRNYILTGRQLIHFKIMQTYDEMLQSDKACKELEAKG